MKTILSTLLNAPRRFLLAAVLGTALVATPVQHAAAQAPVHDWRAMSLTGAWGAAPAGPPLAASTPVFTDQTLRLVVRTSIGGSRVRIRVSNELGSPSATPH